MKALITGASSGIGKDIAIYLSSLGYDLIVVARRKEKLDELKKICKTNVEVISIDLSDVNNCMELYERTKDYNIDVLINNSGFGLCGNFFDTELNKELEMIDLNIKGLHILTKLFLKDMQIRNNGYILNVSSSAAFAPGPLMATYYSTKSYVFKLSQSIYRELKQSKSNVHISVLCPGPVETEFNDVANVKFAFKPQSSKFVAKYAIDMMFKNKLTIVPGFNMKLAKIFSKLLPDKLLSIIIFHSQKRKLK
ncbi:MAG: SDR family oxidoreductase [Firmicutes bacterium]|nr:SDR family oxidoreductase [Bacillota bacterium]